MGFRCFLRHLLPSTNQPFLPPRKVPPGTAGSVKTSGLSSSNSSEVATQEGDLMVFLSLTRMGCSFVFAKCFFVLTQG